jgi:hypothetical protein
MKKNVKLNARPLMKGWALRNKLLDGTNAATTR